LSRSTRIADFLALGEEEGVGHRAADEERVGLVSSLLDDVDFVGDLGATEDRDEGALWVADGFAEELQLLLDQEADRARLPWRAWAAPKVLACSRWAVPKASLT